MSGLRLKTILEVSALGNETAIRSACRIALKYSDMIKMVSGFRYNLMMDEKAAAL